MEFKNKLLISIFFLSACQQIGVKEISATSDLPKFETATITRTSTKPVFTQTRVFTQTITPSPYPTETPSPSQTPIVIVPFLDGTVNEQANCRYGAGTAYLFEWGLYPGDSVRIINRNWDSTWVYVKPVTYNNECWVKASILDFIGNVNNLEEYYSPLPYVYTYLYKPVKYVIVERNGDEVTISWDPIKMTEDDDRGYLIEAWVCQAGSFIFLPISYFPYTNNSAKIIDEPGCAQVSHARFYTVEKHGYMPYIEIPWPPNN